ncbi:MAG: hypothetical protein EHM70_21460 [Chloroflexota bacterium]|nr:MAG: hypothetical protein EHM70_21460 [Chloroflexota bacterium]
MGESRDGAGWAHNFGAGKIVIVDQPVISQAEADALATARLDEISGAFIDAEGEAIRRPDITAGKAVELSALGNRLSGTYLVTSATHTISPEGLKTVFTVRGSRTGLLSEQVNHKPPLDRWAGVVTAVVTNTDDPKDVGRVKLKFPWMTEDAESDWARVIGIGAGKDTGLYVMPKVGDEVLVAFAYGDFSQPFVLGGLWSAINTIPPEAQQAANGEKPLVRTWHSTNGNIIAVYDNADKKIEILTADGRSVTLNDNDRKLTLKTSQVTVTMEDDKLTIEAGTEINIKAGSNMKLEANGNLDIKASGTLTVQSSSVTNIKGSMVNLN